MWIAWYTLQLTQVRYPLNAHLPKVQNVMEANNLLLYMKLW